ncbi:MAG: TIM barrel protein [Nanoarchaeota archaeon]
MVEFGTGYQMPMDREYGNTEFLHHKAETPSPGNLSTNDVGVGIKDLGMSIVVGPVPNVPAVGAKLRAGMKTLEIGFTGAGKGSAQAQTPEYYGKAQRRALEEIRKANEVNFTTHTTTGIAGLAGMDQQGNFSRVNKNFSLQEIKRAVDFAADVAAGGPVVVHTGEFPRPLVDSEWNTKGEDANRFKMYEGEEERASFRVVDARTGSVISEARKNRKVGRPVWNTAKAGEEYTDLHGEQRTAKEGEKVYVDYNGNQVTPDKRVPEFDKEAGVFKTKLMSWDDFKEEAKEMTDRAREFWRKYKNDPEKVWKESPWYKFRNIGNEKEIKIRPEEAYIIGTLETNAANSRGWAFYYSTDFDRHVETVRKLEKAKELYKQIEEAAEPGEKWKLKQQVRSLVGGLVPEEARFPSEIIDEEIRSRKSHMAHAQEGAASQWAQAAETEETIRYVQSAETYALDEAYDAYAQAGISAMKQSERLEKEGKLKKPLAIAMENLFPESYGSHPDELRGLVKGGRAKMVERLVEQGVQENEARKKAEQHITATFDTGHFNLWRKYWQGDPKKTMEENDKEFNNWAIKKVAQLAKEKIIGHVHLVDNYGYQDDHLAPGEGNTPIKEMVKVLKDNGYKGELIVEPGADFTTDVSGFHSVMKTWRLFGSPVYGAGAGPSLSSRGWGEVGYGHFGLAQPPYFVFGAYSPSEDWTLWSGVPLE